MARTEEGGLLMADDGDFRWRDGVLECYDGARSRWQPHDPDTVVGNGGGGAQTPRRQPDVLSDTAVVERPGPPQR